MTTGFSRTTSTLVRAVAIAMALTWTGAAALAADGESAPQPGGPSIVTTADPASRVPGGLADQLLAKARTDGTLFVLVTLRTPLAPEETMTDAEISAQHRQLAQAQDRVTARVLGSAAPASDTKRFTLVAGMAMKVNADQLRRLLDDPEVVSVYEDQVSVPLLDDSTKIIHATDVWAKGFSGTGQTVAIIDTGVERNHPMLKGKVKFEACFSTQNPPAWRSFCTGSAPQEVGVTGAAKPCPLIAAGCDHGTHVASIAAGNSTVHDGVARDANIIAFKVFSRSATNTIGSFESDQILALQEVFKQRAKFKIASINISIGGGKYPGNCDGAFPLTRDAIKKLRDAGIVTVIASGNNNFTGFIDEPACISFAVVAGNSMKNDLVYGDPTFGSNHNSLVDFFAPGTDITAAVTGGGYGVKTGTSMAAPHVAGAWAVLKNAKPDATIDQVLKALTCSGKIIHQRDVPGGTPIELAPARPRIDLIGAFNFLKKPPNVVRTWNFTDAAQGLDWSIIAGKWVVGGGRYSQTPIQQGWVGSATANCNTAFTVTVSTTRTDPGTTLFSNTGVIVDAKIDYAQSTVEGYWIAYNKCRTNKDTNFCTGKPEDKPGQAVFWKYSQNFKTGVAGTNTLLCYKQSPVNVNGLNTIKVVKNGPVHTYYLNNKLVCKVTDPTYKSGAIMVAAYIAAAGGHSYQVDSFSVQTIGTGVASASADAISGGSAPVTIPAGTSIAGSAPQ